MQSNPAALLGRALMASLFIVAGVRKLMSYAMTAGYFAHLGVPLPELVLPATIVVEIGGGLALLLGFRLRWVAPILGLFTVGTALVAHQFWNAPPDMVDAQLNNFLKNMAIAGAFVLITLDAMHRTSASRRPFR